MSHVYIRPLGPFDSRSGDSFLLKTIRWTMRRLTWIIPAAYDAGADDVGFPFQLGLTVILTIFLVGLGLTIFLVSFGVLTLLTATLIVPVFYLVYEIPYRLYARHWRM